MKRKVVLALLAGLTLTVGSFGTAFAMNSNPVIELQDNEIFSQPEDPEEHVHAWGEPTYVKDADAVYGEPEWIVDKEAVYSDPVYVVDKEAEYKDITEKHQFCSSCNLDLTEAAREAGMSITDYFYDVHQLETMHGGYYGDWVVVGQELVSPEEGHWTEPELISPEEGHWGEAPLISPEKGHWEHTCADCGEIQNVETGEVIKPGTLPDEPENPGTDDPTTEEPENPNPDDPTTEEPENPNPDDPTTEEPENPNTGDQTETPNEDKENPTDETETDNNKQDQQDNDKAITTDTTDKSENTDTATTAVSNENKAPQTGDTASLIYLATLAGSTVAGGIAFGLRRKIKK